ncbi:MAG: type VI secretion system protein TssA [Pseudomonadota bacterium]
MDSPQRSTLRKEINYLDYIAHAYYYFENSESNLTVTVTLMPLDTETLLRPIAKDLRTGPDLRAESGLDSVYFKLKDARAQARLAERVAESAGAQLAVSAEWKTVRDLSLEALATRTKDLEIAAWLLEAMTRIEGFAGLAASARLIEGLVEKFWPELHSVDMDDVAGKVSPLAGLNGIGSEGALVQTIRMTPLLPGSSYGRNALWHMMSAQKDPGGAISRSFEEARATATPDAIRTQAQTAREARDAYGKLISKLDTVCGADAPASSSIRDVLDEVVAAYRLLIGEAADVAPSDEPAATPEPAPGLASTAPRSIATREDAFAELLRIADFFRRSEPHSPISYTLETLVARGRMTFIDLLSELMPDAAQRKIVLQHAGIHAKAEAPSR